MQVETIGVIHSPYDQPGNMPIQPSAARGVQGQIEIEPRYAEGLRDLEGFSHIVLLYWFHRSQGYSLQVVPFLDDTPRGLFATRAPRRPNPIGLSVVRLRQVRDNWLYIEDIDAVDGTPLLDIKPYIPNCDEVEDCRLGWLEKRRSRMKDARSDDRFDV